MPGTVSDEDRASILAPLQDLPDIIKVTLRAYLLLLLPLIHLFGTCSARILPATCHFHLWPTCQQPLLLLPA